MDPNSQHQVWSSWIFGIEANPRKLPPVMECIDNARKFFAKGFGRAGRVRCDKQGIYYVFIVEVEGPPALDPIYVESVKKEFVNKFMVTGFGTGAILKRFVVKIISGDQENGQPPDQWLALPRLETTAKLFMT